MLDRTFEMLARWACGQMGVNIVFSDSATHAAVTSEKVITIPSNAKVYDHYAAAALIVHEASHIRHTNDNLAKYACKTQADAEVFNAIEDCRIDLLAFERLNNMKLFYKKLISYEVNCIVDKANQIPTPGLVLARTLIELEGFEEEAEKIPLREGVDYKQIKSLMCQGMKALNANDGPEVADIIKQIKALLKMEDEDKNKEQETQGQTQQANKTMKGGSIHDYANGVLDCPSKTEPVKIDQVNLSEQSIERFKDALRMKFKKILNAGSKLNSRKITKFHTGDVDQLFINNKTERRLKSKIIFMLDTSGSMDETIDDIRRITLMTNIVRALAAAIKELIKQGEIDLDFEVWMFNHTIRDKLKMDRLSLIKYVCPAGGTNVSRCFSEGLKYLKESTDVTGKKLILVATDGDMCERDISELENSLKTLGEEVRCSIVGIEKNAAVHYCINRKDEAENVIYDAILNLI